MISSLKPIDLKNLLNSHRSAIAKTQSKLTQESVRRVSMTFISEVARSTRTLPYSISAAIWMSIRPRSTTCTLKSSSMSAPAKKSHNIFFLKNVKYINNIGLNLLITLNDFIIEKGYVLYLCSLSQQVDFYLRSLGYLDYFNVDSLAGKHR